MSRNKFTSFASVIPAAGHSGRMGSDKASLAFGEGQTFASHLVNSYTAFGAHPVVLIVNEHYIHPDVGNNSFIRLVNEHVEQGRSHSIFLGLQQIPQGSACFIHNVDNPFVAPDLLTQMIALDESDGYVVPLWNGLGGHPVLLGRNMVKYIQGMKALADFREVLHKFKRITLPYPDERIRWNINTRGEYARFLKFQRT